MPQKPKYAPIATLLRKPASPRQLAALTAHGINTIADLLYRVKNRQPEGAPHTLQDCAAYVDEVYEFCNQHLVHLRIDLRKGMRVSALNVLVHTHNHRDYIIPLRGKHFATEEAADTVATTTPTPEKKAAPPSSVYGVFVPNTLLRCPLSGESPRDHADFCVAEDGVTYFEAAIAEYVKVHARSPITGQPMSNRFYPNNLLRQMLA